MRINLSFFNPFSTEHHAYQDLDKMNISKAKKAAIWAVSILCGLVSLGVGGIALFRFLVGRAKPIADAPQSLKDAADKVSQTAKQSGIVINQLDNLFKNGDYCTQLKEFCSFLASKGDLLQETKSEHHFTISLKTILPSLCLTGHIEIVDAAKARHPKIAQKNSGVFMEAAQTLTFHIAKGDDEEIVKCTEGLSVQIWQNKVLVKTLDLNLQCVFLKGSDDAKVFVEFIGSPEEKKGLAQYGIPILSTPCPYPQFAERLGKIF